VDYLTSVNSRLAEVSLLNTLRMLELSVSGKCNFTCQHCIYSNHAEKSGTKGNMTWDVAKRAIDGFFENVSVKKQRKVLVNFGGGEPLMNWEIIDSSLKYIKENYFSENTVSFSINTNLSLLNEKIATAFDDFNVFVSFSLDGTKTANNAIRTNRKYNETFSLIEQKRKLLKNIRTGVNITINDLNYPYFNTNIIDYLYNIGINCFAVNYDLINAIHIPVDRRVTLLLSMIAICSKKNMKITGHWLEPFHNLINNKHGYFCSAMSGEAIAVEYDGRVKACTYCASVLSHLPSASNIKRIFSSTGSLYKLIKTRAYELKSCDACELHDFCGGQCEATREVGGAVFENNCTFYRKIVKRLVDLYDTNPSELSSIL